MDPLSPKFSLSLTNSWHWNYSIYLLSQCSLYYYYYHHYFTENTIIHSSWKEDSLTYKLIGSASKTKPPETPKWWKAREYFVIRIHTVGMQKLTVIFKLTGAQEWFQIIDSSTNFIFHFHDSKVYFLTNRCIFTNSLLAPNFCTYALKNSKNGENSFCPMPDDEFLYSLITYQRIICLAAHYYVKSCNSNINQSGYSVITYWLLL